MISLRCRNFCSEVEMLLFLLLVFLQYHTLSYLNTPRVLQEPMTSIVSVIKWQSTVKSVSKISSDIKLINYLEDWFLLSLLAKHPSKF